MVLHISLLLSIFAGERTRKWTGGAVAKRESQAMSDVGRLMPPYSGLKRYLNNNNVYGKILYISRLATNLLHLQLCDRRAGLRCVRSGM